MFCTHCGKESLERDPKYCSACGHCFNFLTHIVQVALLYYLLRTVKRKSDARKEHFKAKKPKFGKEAPKMVTINIGIMRYVNRALKTCRGRTLPVTVPPPATQHKILSAALVKHANHDRNMPRNMKYTLLYPDGMEVETVPETRSSFVLFKYKEGLGKSYSRVPLFIRELTQ